MTARLGGVLMVSLAGALFAALLGQFFGPKRTADAGHTARPVSTRARLPAFAAIS